MAGWRDGGMAGWRSLELAGLVLLATSELSAPSNQMTGIFWAMSVSLYTHDKQNTSKDEGFSWKRLGGREGGG